MTNDQKIHLVDILRSQFPDLWPDGNPDTHIDGYDVTDLLCRHIQLLESMSDKVKKPT